MESNSLATTPYASAHHLHAGSAEGSCLQQPRLGWWCVVSFLQRTAVRHQLTLPCAGVTALTTLSRLTRLVLEGDGFGIAELAMKVGSFNGSVCSPAFATCTRMSRQLALDGGNSGSGRARTHTRLLHLHWCAHYSHVQLPTLERLDLVLTLAGAMPDPEMEATLGRLPLLGELTALALRAGSMRGLLRHLQLPPGVKAGFPPDPWVVLTPCTQHLARQHHAMADASTALPCLPPDTVLALKNANEYSTGLVVPIMDMHSIRCC